MAKRKIKKIEMLKIQLVHGEKFVYTLKQFWLITTIYLTLQLCLIPRNYKK